MPLHVKPVLMVTATSLQVAATTLHHKALQADRQQYPEMQSSPEALLSQATGSSRQAGPDKGSKAAAQAAELALKREDAELTRKLESERKHLPSNVEGFK